MHATSCPPHAGRACGGWLVAGLLFVLGVLAAVQLFAFWQLCSQQVRRAELRRAEVQVHQMAFAECLQSVPGSTIASCRRAARPSPVDPAPRAAHAGVAALPVGYGLR